MARQIIKVISGKILTINSGKYLEKSTKEAKVPPAAGEGRPIKKFLGVTSTSTLNLARRKAAQAINKNAMATPRRP